MYHFKTILMYYSIFNSKLQNFFAQFCKFPYIIFIAKCEWNEWQDITGCSKTCGGGDKNGLKRQQRTKRIVEEYGGYCEIFIVTMRMRELLVAPQINTVQVCKEKLYLQCKNFTTYSL